MATPSKQKVALITGATGGIGRATAIALAKQGGYNLALHYNSASQTTRDELRSALKAAHMTSSDTVEPTISLFQADMGDYDSVRKLFSAVTSQLGGVDVLFNTAGANAGNNSVQNLADVPIDAFRTDMAD